MKLRRILLAQVAVAGALGVGLGFVGWVRASGLTMGDFMSELRAPEPPRFEWRSIDKRHWQIVTTSSESPEETDARERNGAGCLPGMVRVAGAYRLELGGEMTGEIERLQDDACTDWISRDFPARCRTFDRAKIATEIAKLPTRPLDFCIDRFEYPNRAGESPVIVVTHREAAAFCKKDNKRLCTEVEWTFACEGEEVRPYPYGFERDTTACVMDRSWRPFKEGALYPRDADDAREELDRLWQGEPSGSRAQCRSPFGVHDMTGNVDEWTVNVRSTGYPSVLKGGYWGPVRARCRPATRAHNEDFVAYQQGFRCCAGSDPSVPPPNADVTPAADVDAGPSITTVLVPDRSAPAAVETAPGGSVARAEDLLDEVEVLTRRRSVRACAASPVFDGHGGGTCAALGALAVLLVVARRRATHSATRHADL